MRCGLWNTVKRIKINEKNDAELRGAERLWLSPQAVASQMRGLTRCHSHSQEGAQIGNQGRDLLLLKRCVHV
jgi:hypothetical protein